MYPKRRTKILIMRKKIKNSLRLITSMMRLMKVF